MLCSESLQQGRDIFQLEMIVISSWLCDPPQQAFITLPCGLGSVFWKCRSKSVPLQCSELEYSNVWSVCVVVGNRSSAIDNRKSGKHGQDVHEHIVTTHRHTISSWSPIIFSWNLIHPVPAHASYDELQPKFGKSNLIITLCGGLRMRLRRWCRPLLDVTSCLILLRWMLDLVWGPYICRRMLAIILATSFTFWATMGVPGTELNHRPSRLFTSRLVSGLIPYFWHIANILCFVCCSLWSSVFGKAVIIDMCLHFLCFLLEPRLTSQKANVALTFLQRHLKYLETKWYTVPSYCQFFVAWAWSWRRLLPRLAVPTLGYGCTYGIRPLP